MDAQHLDALVRSISTSVPRRGLLATLASELLTMLPHALLSAEVVAKKRTTKRKSKRKPRTVSPTTPPPPAPPPVPPPCGCASSQRCLSNGSCATVCPGSFACPPVAQCGCYRDTEAEAHCAADLTCDDEAALASCTRTAECPPGFHCVQSSCFGALHGLCQPLCG